jgi:hypothetical protein
MLRVNGKIAKENAMNFGMFTDFHVRDNMSQAAAFEESFNQVDMAEQLGIDTVWHHRSSDGDELWQSDSL